jgi:hypothetical protein
VRRTASQNRGKGEEREEPRLLRGKRLHVDVRV